MVEQQRADKSGSDEKCSICKNSVTYRSTLESCFHSYCFHCITNWSKNPNHRALCPRCDRPYQTILYNIKDDVTYETYAVPESEFALEPKDEILAETECSICLEDFEDRASVEPCLHSFCFKCITGWAKVRSLCPICNGGFNVVYHNVKENQSYEEYEVKKTEKPARQNVIAANDPYLSTDDLRQHESNAYFHDDSSDDWLDFTYR